MEIQELLARLDQHQGPFPEELVAEVIARRDEATPQLLQILETIDRNPEPWLADGDGMLHILGPLAEEKQSIRLLTSFD